MGRERRWLGENMRGAEARAQGRQEGVGDGGGLGHASAWVPGGPRILAAPE